MTDVRHDAKYSENVVACFAAILNETGPDDKPICAGPVVDPFAGLGLRLDDFGRDDVSGIELEAEWAAVSKRVSQGDALDVLAYPVTVGTIATSVCYGNRFADQYLGPKCGACDGSGLMPSGVEHFGAVEMVGCPDCEGIGYDRRGRYGYAISLGRKVSDGSAAALQWGPKYRSFHADWLRTIGTVLLPGSRRLLLNISDHHRAKSRRYVVQWWIEAAGRAGFRLVEAHAVDTPRFGHGQNQESKPESEMVLVFDFLGRDVGDE